MYHSGLTVVFMLLVACSERTAGPTTAEATGSLAENQGADGGPMVGMVGSSPPPASTEDTSHAQQCSTLSEDAARTFNDSLADVESEQCAVDADCQRVAFFATNDGCWATCGVEHGTREYGDALKDLVADQCATFFAAGCTVPQPGCPPSPSVTFTCVDAKCEPANN